MAGPLLFITVFITGAVFGGFAVLQVAEIVAMRRIDEAARAERRGAFLAAVTAGWFEVAVGGRRFVYRVEEVRGPEARVYEEEEARAQAGRSPAVRTAGGEP